MTLEAQMKNTAVSATYRICITPRTATNHPKLQKAAHNAGITGLTSIISNRLCFLEGSIMPKEAAQLAKTLLADPVVEEFTIDNLQLTIYKLFRVLSRISWANFL